MKRTLPRLPLVLLAPRLASATTYPLRLTPGPASAPSRIRPARWCLAPKVSLTNTETGLTVSTVAEPNGNYAFTPVKIGTYSIAAESQGFRKTEQQNIHVDVQQQVVVDLTLLPGQLTQTVEVTSAPPQLQTQEASVGQVVGAHEVNSLPLNGRNFTFLAQIVAGVNTPQADTRGNAASGAFSANGERRAQNNYLLDGIDNNSNTIDFLNGTNFVVLPPRTLFRSSKSRPAITAPNRARGRSHSQRYRQIGDQPASRRRVGILPRRQAGRRRLL